MPPQRWSADRPPSLRRWVALLAAWGAMAALWCLALPAIAARPAVQSCLREQATRGIDPSAMFYTELPAMDDALAQVDRAHRRDPQVFWVAETR